MRLFIRYVIAAIMCILLIFKGFVIIHLNRNVPEEKSVLNNLFLFIVSSVRSVKTKLSMYIKNNATSNLVDFLSQRNTTKALFACENKDGSFCSRSTQRGRSDDLSNKSLLLFNLYRPTDLSDLFISVKTTSLFHASRLPIILQTWYLIAAKQV